MDDLLLDVEDVDAMLRKIGGEARHHALLVTPHHTHNSFDGSHGTSSSNTRSYLHIHEHLTGLEALPQAARGLETIFIAVA